MEKCWRFCKKKKKRFILFADTVNICVLSTAFKLYKRAVKKKVSTGEKKFKAKKKLTK